MTVTFVTPGRINGLILLLCAMALASPLVEAVPGRSSNLFWVFRAAGVAMAIAGLVWIRFQPAALAGVAAFLVVAPCLLQVHYRHWTGAHTWCHDSVVQFEEAIRMLKAGENPYARDFSDTALARWKAGKDNPAVHHFVYPPLTLLISVPVETASRAVLWKTPPGVDAVGARFYDQRVVLLVFFLGLLALFWRFLEGHPHRIGLLSLVALNPWFAPFIVEGRNDVAMIFWVAVAWIAFESGRVRAGHLLLGLAIATKTLLLPILPFVAAVHGRKWPACVALLLAPLAVTSLPFLIADAPAFVDDLFGAPSGWGDHPFEIRGWGGFGFANLVLLTGLASSPQARFPFAIFQLAALAPVLYYGLRSLRRDPTITHALLWSAGAVFAVLFFGRFVHDNYIGSLLSLVVISQAARAVPQEG